MGLRAEARRGLAAEMAEAVLEPVTEPVATPKSPEAVPGAGLPVDETRDPLFQALLDLVRPNPGNLPSATASSSRLDA